MLVGREDELRRIERLLASESLPTTIVLRGDAGIGKTSLWLAGLQHASSCGYRVLVSRPTEAETRLSYAGLADLLAGSIDDALPDLPPIQRRALERALLLDDGVGHADERAIAAAFLSVVRNLGRIQPVCLAIDDLQWLDAASLDVLRFALARLGEDNVASLLAVRGELPGWLGRATPPDRLATFEIEGLSIGALQELLRERLGAGLARPTLVRVWETSGGNPFFALEVARALQRRGFSAAPSQPLPVPSSLDELLRERLDGLGPEALEIATVSAALSDPTTGLVAAAVGDAAHAGIPEALDAQVLELDGDRLRFAHPLLGSAVTARQTHLARTALHARLATLAPTREERARHLAISTVRPDREIAAEIEEAARDAHARGAPIEAAQLADHSARLTPREALADRQRRLLLAADRYYVAADAERATALLVEARDSAAPGRERAVVLIQLARVAASPRDATDLLLEGLGEAGDDDELVAEIHLTIAGHQRFVEGVERGLYHAELAVGAAARAGGAAIRCRALAASGLLHFNAGQGIRKVEMEEALALERSLPDWPLEEGPAFVYCHQLVWAGEVDRARDVARELEVALAARDDLPGRADALWYLALVEWRAGNWAEADRFAAAELELTTLVGRAMPNEEFPTAIVDAHLGRAELAVRRAESAIVRARGESMLVAEQGFDWILGFVRLSLGDPPAAVENLRRAHELRKAIGIGEPAMCFELGDLLETLVATGELDEVERLLAESEPRAVALDRAWALAILARGSALLLAARRDLGGAFEAFERALAEHARVTDPFQHARTLLALGRTQRRAKKRGAARATLEEALAGFERLGALLWVEQTRAELARIGGRTASRTELTEAERRIALLVVQGRRNREVAAELYLTEHSVETALSRIYRKLGIRSRGELGRVLSNS